MKFLCPVCSANMEVNFIFFAMESTMEIERSGRAMPTGIPGKPPPQPTSRHFALSISNCDLTMLSECMK